MPQFTVPQFEIETKVVWIFTLPQLIFVGIAGAICFLIWFTIGKENLLLFMVITTVLMSGAFSLAFVKIGGRGLPTIFKNLLIFSVAPKIYLWKKKEMPPKIIKRVEEKIKAEIETTPALRFAEKSRLKKLSTQIETKTR